MSHTIEVGMPIENLLSVEGKKVNDAFQYLRYTVDTNFATGEILRYPKEQRLLTPRIEADYEFATARIAEYSREIGQQIKHLDIGMWIGKYLHHFTERPEIAEIEAIDIENSNIEKVRKRPELQDDLKTGRLRTRLMNGTDMTYEDERFDSVTSIEVLVGLEGGAIRELFREKNRVLKPGGLAFSTFLDGIAHRDDKQLNWEHKEHAYARDNITSAIIEEFRICESDIKWFGQFPAITIPSLNFLIMNTITEIQGFSTIDKGYLAVQPIERYKQINAEWERMGIPAQVIPLFWTAEFQKPLAI